MAYPLRNEHFTPTLTLKKKIPLLFPFIMHRPTTEERLGRSTSSSSLTRYFLLAMAVVYFGLGVYLLLAPNGAFNLPVGPRRILGGVFIFYGIIRFVRIYRQHFQKNNERDAR